ncbi:TRAP transporter substrate-binding protein [Paracoccus sp. 1_MG-2023]|uniref:TRAP transporter substrate-binding protein n=1 Tax=unclassified Paracoccus (in: a-proteobacteria) TaxID=2688777 RepID=UPI001C09F5CD|nr:MULTISPECIES: TRAP transporter substrate-binding protein [unclassified Paracoccus (in: a-proteobacteria)]MBU2956058.1 TRAP transporter substrate-binding protein [Paracoccus sp. C2R09]MDO6669464.1 TRAP transporter substrate-binding protein [Paracoccus sp. 1_MG-2023]
MTVRTFALNTTAALGVAMLATPAMSLDLRGWNIHVEDYPVSIAMEAFVEEVEEKTGGEITGKVFHNGVLGDQPDAIEQVRLGVIDFGEFSLGPMGQSVPEANVVSLPFIFSSVPKMYELMDGEVGAAIGEGMKAKGIMPLGWYTAGARSFYTASQPIAAPEDVQGLKIRVMSNDLFVDMVESMGGNATPMAFGEVYQSIKTGVVDGAENNPPSYESTAHHEVAKYLSLTEHLIIPECLCMSLKTWEKLTPEQQDVVMEAGRNSTEMQRQLWEERVAASLDTVRSAGGEITEVADKAPFQEAMAPVYEGFLEENPDLTELVEMIRNAE